MWSRPNTGSTFTVSQTISNPWQSGVLPGWPAQDNAGSSTSWAGGEYQFWGTGIGFSGDGRTLIAESYQNNMDDNNCATPFGTVTVFTRASTSDSFTFQNVMPYSRFKGQPAQYVGQRYVGNHQYHIDLFIDSNIQTDRQTDTRTDIYIYIHTYIHA